MEKAEDRRVQRTRGMLLDALIDLMIEKGYEEITIQDIVDYANVGRSTFYLHFTDKEQLLLASINMLREFLKEQSANRSSDETPSDNLFRFSLAMLQHAQSHKKLHKAIVGKKGGATVMYHMKRMLVELLTEEVTELLPDSALPIPKEIVIDFIANTFNTLLAWWMEQNMPCPATEVNRIFHQLTLSGLRAFNDSI